MSELSGIPATPAVAPVVAEPVVAPVTTDWRANLSDDLRSSKGLESVKDVESLAKQFLDAQSHIGNSIRIPGEDAGQDAAVGSSVVRGGLRVRHDS
jgi:hypothetical protein